MLARSVTLRCNNTGDSKKALAFHAGVFRGARISSLPTRDERRALPKTPAWEAKKVNTLCDTGYPMYSCVLLMIYKTEYRTERSVFFCYHIFDHVFSYTSDYDVVMSSACSFLSVDQRQQLHEQEKKRALLNLEPVT